MAHGLFLSPWSLDIVLEDAESELSYRDFSSRLKERGVKIVDLSHGRIETFFITVVILFELRVTVTIEVLLFILPTEAGVLPLSLQARYEQCSSQGVVCLSSFRIAWVRETSCFYCILRAWWISRPLLANLEVKLDTVDLDAMPSVPILRLDRLPRYLSLSTSLTVLMDILLIKALFRAYFSENIQQL